MVLPLRRGAALAAPQSSAGIAPARTLQHCSLLIVEANPLAQSVLRSTFAGKVGRLEVVASGAEAREALKLAAFDHLLADAAALGADDAERAQSLSQIVGQTGGAVTVMCPSPSQAQREQFTAAGAAQVLAKPITPAQLLEALRRWFEPHGPAAANPGPIGVTAY